MRNSDRLQVDEFYLRVSVGKLEKLDVEAYERMYVVSLLRTNVANTHSLLLALVSLLKNCVE